MCKKVKIFSKKICLPFDTIIAYMYICIYILYMPPWGHSGPLAFIFFSMTASPIALRPSCTVFAVISNLHCSPCPVNWTYKAESNIPCTCIGEPLFA